MTRLWFIWWATVGMGGYELFIQHNQIGKVFLAAALITAGLMEILRETKNKP